MVDINLFKDDDSEEQDQPLLPEGDDSALDGLDDFDFDEPLSDFDEPVKEEGDLLESDPLPVFDDDQEEPPEGDYDFSESVEKRTPLWIWGVLAVAVVAVLVWLFVIQPRQVPKVASPVQVVKPPVSQQTPVRPDTTQSKAVTPVKDSAQAQKPAVIAPVVNVPKAEGVGSLPVYTQAAQKIVDSFTATGQFAGIFLSGTRFFAVEYVSATRGVGEAMAHRIQTLLGVQGVKTSPEEGHRTAGSTHYYGVISGELPSAGVGAQSGQGAAYVQPKAFEEAMRALAGKHRFKIKGLSKLVQKQEGVRQMTDYRIKLEGQRVQLQSFLDGLSTLGANAFVLKMNLAPSQYTDFKASTLKLTLEYRVSVGG